MCKVISPGKIENNKGVHIQNRKLKISGLDSSDDRVVYLRSIKESQEIKPLLIVCADCKHEYNTPFTLNVANFFV